MRSHSVIWKSNYSYLLIHSYAYFDVFIWNQFQFKFVPQKTFDLLVFFWRQTTFWYDNVNRYITVSDCLINRWTCDHSLVRHKPDVFLSRANNLFNVAKNIANIYRILVQR